MPASPRWRHDGEVWTLARPDGATLCAYEADVGLWGWTLSRLVDGDVVTLHDSGGQWATAAEAKRAATGTATLVDARPCPACARERERVAVAFDAGREGYDSATRVNLRLLSGALADAGNVPTGDVLELVTRWAPVVVLALCLLALGPTCRCAVVSTPTVEDEP